MITRTLLITQFSILEKIIDSNKYKVRPGTSCKNSNHEVKDYPKEKNEAYFLDMEYRSEQIFYIFIFVIIF